MTIHYCSETAIILLCFNTVELHGYSRHKSVRKSNSIKCCLNHAMVSVVKETRSMCTTCMYVLVVWYKKHFNKKKQRSTPKWYEHAE